MKQLDRLERDLTVWFAETAAPHTPPYLDDILQHTARLRQRPRWTFFERLIPMTATTSFRAVTAPVPWRTLGALALLLLALVVGAILIGSAQRRLPEPFGLAAPGLVAYSSDGDIFVVDPATNGRHPIVAGPEIDLNPQWSRDGTQIVFARTEGKLTNLWTVRSDGSGLALITPESKIIVGDPLSADYSFSPDGRSVLFLTASAIQIAQVDGSGVSEIRTPGVAPHEAAWRPPEGTQIGVLGLDGGIYLVNVADGTIQTVVAPDPQSEGVGLAWSPDGSEVTYGRWNDTTALVADMRAYITDIATGQERLVDPAGGAFWEGWAAWSNDGRRIALMRAYTDGFSDVTAMIIATDGTGSRIETAHGLGLTNGCCASYEWAPDDSSILWAPANSRAQMQINPDTGTVTAAPWNAVSDPAWQRLAP